MRILTCFSLLGIFFTSATYAQTAINAYGKVTSVSGGSTLTLSNVNEIYDKFEAGENVIIMQMQDDVLGANTADDESFGDIGDIGSAGLFEPATIQSVSEASQTVDIWCETFEDLSEGDADDAGLTAWSASCGNCGGFRYFQVRQDATLGGGYLFGGRQMTSGGTWTSDPISISGYTNVSLSVDVAQSGFDDGNDNITVSYRLDGVGGFTTVGSMQSGAFASTTLSVSSLSGTSIEVRVVINSNQFGDTGLFDNVKVSGDTPLPISITLTEPLENSYSTGSNASLQIISFPEFANYTTASDLTALPWDGNVGGVFAIDVTNTLTLQNDITVDGTGFRGGINDIPEGNNYNTCNNAVYRTNNTNFALKGEGTYKITDSNYERGKGHVANGGGAPNTYKEGGAGGGNFTAGGYGSIGECYDINVIWQEDFETGYGGGETSGANNNTANGANDWTTSIGGGTFQVQNAAIADNGNVSGYYFYSDQTTGSTWTSELINISGYTDVALLIDFDNNGNLDGADVMDFEYNLDAAGWVSFANYGSLSDDGLFEIDGSGTAEQFGLSGTNVQIRVTVTVANANDNWLFDNIRVGEVILEDNAPRGGADLSNYISPSRVFMGGGGGASGDDQDNGGGGNGGGIVLIRASMIDYVCGSYTISADGEPGYSAAGVLRDSGSGAGAGGSVVFQVDNWTTETCMVVSASGGDGGDVTYLNNPSGMAGGGGRGVVIFSSAVPGITIDTSQGAQGTNNNGASGSASEGSTTPENPSAPANGVFESSPGVLPVSLLYWNAKAEGSKVVLSWATGKELNNDYFTIERSSDADNWQLLATVKGAGTTNSKKYYDMDDRQPLPAVNYYRLSQTDYDGTKEVFDIIAVEMESFGGDLVAYPNPNRGRFRVKLPNQDWGSLNLTMLDITGRAVSAEFRVEGNEIIVSCRSLQPGSYFVKIVAGNVHQTLKVIID
ncbi:MAG: T9SS type A sorting domain-containing protein [Imperialibacter sp.]|uniref:T9SS type A sorting domain-containing protein n=1 Tax=Imperialibacter sp. TaxID=2038411 RepID=UPI003A8B268E